MPYHWALFYFAQLAKSITGPKRRASVAETSVGQVCGYSYARNSSKGATVMATRKERAFYRALHCRGTLLDLPI